MREPGTAIRSGLPVYDVAGKKLGTVVADDPANGYLTMRRGVLVHRTVYVPLGAIAQADGDAISLSLSKAEVRRRPWDRAIVYEGAAPSARPPDRGGGTCGRAPDGRDARDETQT
jgi:hypothetical protein